MKSLEKFSDLKISAEELEAVNGGAPIHSSGTINGSKWTFDGDVSNTHMGTEHVYGGQNTEDVWATDYCGQATCDGVVRSGCFNQL